MLVHRGAKLIRWELARVLVFAALGCSLERTIDKGAQLSLGSPSQIVENPPQPVSTPNLQHVAVDVRAIDKTKGNTVLHRFFTNPILVPSSREGGTMFSKNTTLIDAIELNQGVGILLMSGGKKVSRNSYDASVPLVPGREAVVRFAWQALGTQSTVEALVAIRNPGEPLRVFSQIMDLESRGSLTTLHAIEDTINVTIPPRIITSKSRFAFAFIDKEGIILDRFPRNNSKDWEPRFLHVPTLPIETNLKLAIVPISIDCDEESPLDSKSSVPPKLSPLRLKDFENWIYNNLPVSNLELKVLDKALNLLSSHCDASHKRLNTRTVVTNQELILALIDRKRQDNLGTEWFYQGFIVNDSNKSGFLGFSLIGNSSIASERVGWFEWGGIHSGDLSVHELGHSLGIYHSFDVKNGDFEPQHLASCGGRTSFGLGMRPSLHPRILGLPPNYVYPPTSGCQGEHFDVMSHNFNYWVGSGTFTKMAATLVDLAQNILSSKSAQHAPALVGVYSKTGELSWTTSNGVLSTLTSLEESRPHIQWNNGHKSPLELLMGGDGELMGIKVVLGKQDYSFLDDSFTIQVPGESPTRATLPESILKSIFMRQTH